MEKERKTKENKGITLIALVVTIIVLLILAGISISMLTGQNGILNRATEAKQETEKAEIIERTRLDILAEQAINGGNVTSEGLKTILDNYFTNVPATLPEDATELANLELTSKNGGYPIKVGEIWIGTPSGGTETTPGGTTDTLPSATETTPYLPSSDFSQVTGTDLETGLVIEDEIGNQYVWIEVPRTAEVYPTAGTGITNFTEVEYTDIENDLHTYTNTYRNGTSYTDTYYADTDNEGWFANEAAYNTEKQKMLKSIYQNGGFWIGRYEAGIETNRTVEGEATIVPQSKENLYPYTYVTRTQAKVLAEQANSGNYTSSLMFGVQWDLVLKYLETKGATVEELNTDSTSWGNYRNATFTLNRGKFAKYGALSTWYDYTAESLPECVTGGVKQSVTSYTNSILLTTGASNVTSKQNIYDIAGNVSEWTLEYTSNSRGPCSFRGGDYNSYGSAVRSAIVSTTAQPVRSATSVSVLHFISSTVS